MDILSEVLSIVKLNGAVFFNAEFSAPWSFRSPHSREIGPYVGAAGAHIIVYHLLIEGSAWAKPETGKRVALQAGDIVLFPHGDPHMMGNGSPIETVDNGSQLARIFSQGLEITRMGGGGERTRFVCGYMSCEPQVSSILLSGLPPILRVSIGDDPSGVWLENSIRFSVDRAATSAPGAEAVMAKLSEALFVETVRRYISALPAEETGWLAGARDPEVGKALALLHRQIAHPWTIAELAHALGLSRSVLAERFRHYLSEPPMAYLARWRMAVGARLLHSTRRSVAEIASEVGYDSEAAFNRAFKRQFGVPPARYRRETPGRSGESAASATARQ